MRAALMAMSLCMTLAGCSREDVSGRQIGTWGLDGSLLQQDSLAMVPKDASEKRRKLRALMEQLMTDLMTVEFTNDKIIVNMMIGRRAAPYTVRSIQGDDIFLDVMDGSKKKELKLTMQGDDKLITDLARPEHQLFTFRRMY